ncbi:MAG: MATE family efflux transporter [Intestinibacter sp.]|uniref:MATE family efflux transporter n=1 Tax=Intestinibacter sp. TaxID=1965304 RepID=UPI0025BBBAC9|nr:MATE family efflux transporter [Intestinibacter sp.]MCI6737376.1 MATE family efflux transporter [Intestinibacter sp.]
MTKSQRKNPLGCEPVSKLMRKFAVPSIIAMLVGALYNIVDQLFIGQYVGTLGNAATNIAFPLSTSCIALALLFGIGGASCFNLSMGRGEKEKAGYYIGNAAFMLFISGLVLCILSQIFLITLLKAFGAPDDVLPYAETYVRITAIGFPFFILTVGGGHLIRADGSPRIAMMCSLLGAIINIVLDAVFIMGFNMGMAGAAYATIIGQIASGIVVIVYLKNYKTVVLAKKHFKVKFEYTKEIMSIGTASFINQLAMMLLQVVLNNSLKYYGSLSIYGEAIPIACSGIVMKVAQLFFSIVIGLAQGSQPIQSFNYGAKKYDRVKESYKLANIYAGLISVLAFVLFQVFPRQIMSMFGEGTEAYYQFGISYFRIFLFFICVNFVQPITATLFTSIGKPVKGTFLSLTRQIIFLLPLIIILPLFLGIDGILYSAPIADFIAFIVALVMAAFEFRNMKRLAEEDRNLEAR